MADSPVTLSSLHALFSEHFMGDATNDGAWLIMPRGLVGCKACRWFDAHARDSLRGQFWSMNKNGLVCADAIEAASILIDLEREYRHHLALSDSEPTHDSSSD